MTTPTYYPTNKEAVEDMTTERLAHEYRKCLSNAKQARLELVERGWTVILALPDNPTNAACVKVRISRSVNTTEEL
jgi:hypothetical protein